MDQSSGRGPQTWVSGTGVGTATAAVLDGQVDPSGHLPLTFPAVGNPDPVGTSAQYPGVDEHQLHRGPGHRLSLVPGHRGKPQFPFGFGLSYTSFTLSHPTIHPVGSRVIATVTVTNAGTRAGRAVVQAYLRYPPAAGEPPEQLRALASVSLAPHQSQMVLLTLPMSAFQADVNGSEQVVPGDFVDIGQSSADLPIHLPTAAP